jgi:hypothetical protein
VAAEEAEGHSVDPRPATYSLTFSVNARDLFNIVNDSTPAGSLGSRQFDLPNSLAGGPFGNASAVRQVQLQAQFSF